MTGFARQGVLSVAPSMNPADIARLKARFEALLGGTIDFTVQEDALLIGGFTAQIDGKFYDASVRAKFEEMRGILRAR